MTHSVELTVNGRIKRLKFTISEVKALEARLGKPAGDIFADLGKLSITSLQQVLWAALRHEDKKLRFEDVETMLQAHLEGGGSLLEFLYAINDAAVASGLFGRGAGDEEAKTTTG
mgnify:CR=1 FL=1